MENQDLKKIVINENQIKPPKLPLLIEREQLEKELESVSELSCILVIGPVGYGKTSLIANWISIKMIHYSWLKLDQRNNDLLIFVFYFIASIQRVQQSFGQELLDQIKISGLPIEKALVEQIIQELETISKPFCFVLDDYHFIEKPVIHHFLELLIEKLPEQIIAILITRENPPIHLNKLRLEDKLLEIREKDLSFNFEQTKQFLSKYDVTLSPEELNKIYEETEGWPAGIKLCGIALSQLEEKNISEFIKDFSTNNHYIIEYFLEEIIENIPLELKHFIYQVGLLDEVTAELADFVTEQDSSSELLAKLVRLNLLIRPLDTQGSIFRFHNLFTSFIKSRVDLMEKTTVYLQAAKWFEQKNRYDEAIYYFNLADASEEIERVVQSRLTFLFEAFQFDRFLLWFEKLDSETQQKYLGYKAWALWLAGKINQAKSHLIFTGLPKQDALIHSLSIWIDPESNSEKHQLLSLQLAQKFDTVYFKSLILLSLGYGLFLNAKMNEAEIIFSNALTELEQGNNKLLLASLVHHLSLTKLEQGKVEEAEKLCHSKLDFMIEQDGEISPLSWLIQLPLGIIQAESLEHSGTYYLDQAKNLLLQSPQALHFVNESIFTEIYDAYSQSLNVETSYNQTKEFFSHIPEERYSRIVRISTLDIQQEFQSHLKEEPSSLEQYSHMPLSILKSQSFINFKAQITNAKLHLLHNNLDQADIILSSFTNNLVSEELVRLSMIITLLKAVLAERQGLHAETLGFMEQALQIASTTGLLGSLIRGISGLQNYLKEFETRYSMIIKSCQRFYRQKSEEATNQSIADNPNRFLSKREKEILVQLSQGFNNQELADKLFISVGTIKWHLNNIYSKLEVENRTKAIQKAKKLGLL